MPSSEENSTKGHPEKDTGAGGEENLISLEDLDKVIAEEDPAFQEELAVVATSEGVGDLNIELIDLDRLLEEQEAKSLKSRARRLLRRVRNLLIGLRTSSVYFLKNGVPSLLRGLKDRIGSVFGAVGGVFRAFGRQSLKKKAFVILFLVLCGGVCFVFLKMATQGLVPASEPLLVQSLESMATETLSYDVKAEREPFYSSVRVAQNIVLLQKMVVNLKKSPASGRNPMGAVEIYLEGMSSDVMVELKDRESEFRDHLMRTMEDFSYDDLASVEGKVRLQEIFARQVNALATKGKIRKVYFKSFVLKP